MPLTSVIYEDKSLTPEYGFIISCLFFSKASNSPVSSFAFNLAFLAFLPEDIVPATDPATATPALTIATTPNDIVNYLSFLNSSYSK